MKEALKLALEALQWSKPHEDAVITHGEAITAIKAALAQDETSSSRGEQEPVAWMLIQGRHEELSHWPLDDGEISRGWEQYPLYTTPPQRTEERNFCPRCGKRTADLTVIHTCTPPQPEQEPVAWKLMPRDATDSMLKAMDECSTEGYDERLYAGHAASVYMAAWDEAPTLAQPEQEPVAYLCENAIGHKYFGWKKPSSTYKPIALYTTPPQRTWVGLTDEDKKQIAKEANYNWEMTTGEYAERIGRLTEAKLKELNT